MGVLEPVQDPNEWAIYDVSIDRGNEVKVIIYSYEGHS